MVTHDERIIRNSAPTTFAVALLALGALAVAVGPASTAPVAAANYPLASTGQDRCFDERRAIACPAPGQAFDGQDAQRPGSPAGYRDNRNGTILAGTTGLTWAKAPSQPMTHDEAAAYARASRLGGRGDWRVPSVRELYSLIDFRGGFVGDPGRSRPYIDLQFFDFAYGPSAGLGDAQRGRRPIDVQEWTSTRYVGRTMGRDETIFGVNFADGRIKGYPLMDPANRMQSLNRLTVRLVRGPAYGINDFVASDVTVRDRATGLEWQRADDGQARSWKDALAYCRTLRLAGHRDWYLPNAKELHSIVDYTRIPALDDPFTMTDRAGYFWTSTTHLEGPPPQGGGRPFSSQGELAVYLAFGPALGRMEDPPGSGTFRWLDVHGAGAQRSDPKTAAPGSFPNGFGPQGDDVRGQNYVRCVRRTAP